MPNLKSSIKRLRQSQRAAVRNKGVRTLLRSTLRRVRTTTSKSEGESLLPEAVAVIDRSAKKGVIHRNAASRYKSQLTRHVSGLQD